MRFGINHQATQTLEQVGRVLGFSKERIRQLENEALRSLRRKDECQEYKMYLAG